MSDIEPVEITSELGKSYLDYAMSVIVSRALPDVRDGLKPVHRRVLWAMWDMGVLSTAKFRKSAYVVGETMAKYHPHGDSSIYDTMVRMAQDFSLRYPLVRGQGNFGSIDGDPPAAMRYTEAKLAAIADEMLLDIEKETVDWAPNYDATRNEPMTLPAKLPNLLLNGAVGIAVGMATNIPPHNLGEIVDAILHLADNPDATSEDLTEFVKGPDFPTGGIIYDTKAIRNTYVTGRGGVLTRAKAEIVEKKNSRQFDIVVTEIPYQVNKSELIKTIAELAQDKKIEGIRDLRDESDREGMRIVIELKNDVAPQKVLNWLFKHTDLEKNFNCNMIALVSENGGLVPRLLTLKDILAEYLAYRKEVIRRRTQFDLRKAEERAHILEGLVIALDAIDRVIATIRKSKDKVEAHENLMKLFKLSDLQATAILEMRLQTLAALERYKIEEELKEKHALIEELKAILKSVARMLKIIKDEITTLKEKYGDPRRTRVVARALESVSDEDLIPEEEAMVTVSGGGYIKRLPPDTFKVQRRGGKGLIGSDVGDEDFLSHFFSANTHDNVLFFTDRGRVFQTKVYEIPQATRTSKGRAIQNFLELPADERVSAIVNYASKDGATKSAKDALTKTGKDTGGMKYLMMVTKQGVIKKTPIEDFENIRRTGIIAISLKKGDQLKWAKLTTGNDQVILATRQGQSIRFDEKQARPMGRTAAGVRAIKLKKQNDEVAGFDIIKGDDSMFLIVMEHGFAKQTVLKEYKKQARGGSGIKTADVTPKTGMVIAAHIITDQTEIFALSAKGQMIRTELKTVRTTGRSAQGVRIMNLNAGDKIAGTVVA
jgi:DNA gyrase subunit A